MEYDSNKIYKIIDNLTRPDYITNELWRVIERNPEFGEAIDSACNILTDFARIINSSNGAKIVAMFPKAKDYKILSLDMFSEKDDGIIRVNINGLSIDFPLYWWNKCGKAYTDNSYLLESKAVLVNEAYDVINTLIASNINEETTLKMLGFNDEVEEKCNNTIDELVSKYGTDMIYKRLKEIEEDGMEAD